jgi:3-dehydroquinate dehydratase-1
MREIKKDTFTSCIPLTGQTLEEIKFEIYNGVEQQCDYFEWRRDFYRIDEVRSQKQEENDLMTVRKMIGNIGLIYTFRGQHEGGVGNWSEIDRIKGIKAAIQSGAVDYIDFELDNNEEFHQEIDEALQDSKTRKILSSHNFKKTPSSEEITEMFLRMEENKADILKIAVNIVDGEDLHSLAKAALNYVTNRTMIVIGMGSKGLVTRIAPEVFGGSLSFAAGLKKTAPGQLNIAEIIKKRVELGLS